MSKPLCNRDYTEVGKYSLDIYGAKSKCLSCGHPVREHKQPSEPQTSRELAPSNPTDLDSEILDILNRFEWHAMAISTDGKLTSREAADRLQAIIAREYERGYKDGQNA